MRQHTHRQVLQHPHFHNWSNFEPVGVLVPARSAAATAAVAAAAAATIAVAIADDLPDQTSKLGRKPANKPAGLRHGPEPEKCFSRAWPRHGRPARGGKVLLTGLAASRPPGPRREKVFLTALRCGDGGDGGGGAQVPDPNPALRAGINYTIYNSSHHNRPNLPVPAHNLRFRETCMPLLKTDEVVGHSMSFLGTRDDELVDHQGRASWKWDHLRLF